MSNLVGLPPLEEPTLMDQVAPRLYQGSLPPVGEVLSMADFHLLILAAFEHQPPASNFPGVRVIHAPMDDARRPPNAEEWEVARQASRQAAQALMMDRRVLVTCYSGLNRSGIITAMTLLRIYPASKMTPKQAIQRVQRRRPGSLFNPFFVDALLRIDRA